MKYLGIDYGSRRIGFSVSDEKGLLAFPKGTIQNEGLNKTLEKMEKIIKDEGVVEVVIGHSANWRGEDNPVMASVRQFKDEMERRLEVKTHLEPEFYTTIEASRITGRTSQLDAQAAAIILQSFLNKLQNNEDRA